jgi:hypothetical protein
MTPLDDIRNDLLRLAMMMLRQGEQEDSQPKYDLASSLSVVAAAIDEQQLEGHCSRHQSLNRPHGDLQEGQSRA